MLELKQPYISWLWLLNCPGVEPLKIKGSGNIYGILHLDAGRRIYKKSSSLCVWITLCALVTAASLFGRDDRVIGVSLTAHNALIIHSHKCICLDWTCPFVDDESHHACVCVCAGINAFYLMISVDSTCGWIESTADFKGFISSAAPSCACARVHGRACMCECM